MPPPAFTHSNPGICGCVTLHHTKGFADRIKFKILKDLEVGKIMLEPPGVYNVTPGASQERDRCAESVRRCDDLMLLALRRWRMWPESGSAGGLQR